MVDRELVEKILSVAGADERDDLERVLTSTTEPLLPASSYPDPSSVSGLMECLSFPFNRARYVMDYGYVLLTQECVSGLAALLAGKKTIDIGSGTGYLVHCLRTAGVDATALDLPTLGTHEHLYWFRQIWALDIADDFSRHLPGGYDAVILSWPDRDEPFAFDVAKAMQPGQMLVYQGEFGNGVTANEDFFAYLRGSEWESLIEDSDLLNKHHRQFPGLKDHWRVFRKTVPTARSPYADLKELFTVMRPLWQRLMADDCETVPPKDTSLYAARLLSALLENFADLSVTVCGGSPDEAAGLYSEDGRLHEHYWVEGTTADGVPFVADLGAEQLGGPSIVLVHPDEGRARYRPGSPERVEREIEREMVERAARQRPE
jgi:hypothetical protein